MLHTKYTDVDLAAYLGHTKTAQPSLVESMLERIPLVKMAHGMRAEWWRCVTNTSYIPRYFFHGTTVDRLDSIKESGLNPERAFLGYIYLATSYHDAEQWAKIKSIQRKSRPVVLYVDRRPIPEMNVVRRDNGTFRCSSIIPKEETRRVTPILEFLLK